MDNLLGETLERLRGKLPLRTVAERSGLSHAYIRDLELGINRKTKAPIKPSPEVLKSLSNVYGFSYIELMYMAGYVDEAEDLSLEETEVEAKRKLGLEYISRIKDDKTLDLAIELLEKLSRD